jgi:hypothetical protein
MIYRDLSGDTGDTHGIISNDGKFSGWNLKLNSPFPNIKQEYQHSTENFDCTPAGRLCSTDVVGCHCQAGTTASTEYIL